MCKIQDLVVFRTFSLYIRIYSLILGLISVDVTGTQRVALAHYQGKGKLAGQSITTATWAYIRRF